MPTGRQSDWALLPVDVLWSIYALLQHADKDQPPRDRLAGEQVCTPWAAALRYLPFPTLSLTPRNVRWVAKRQPAVKQLRVIQLGPEVSQRCLAKAIREVAFTSSWHLQRLTWHSGEGCSLNAAIPHSCSLSHLRQLDIQLGLCGEHPPPMDFLTQLTNLRLSHSGGDVCLKLPPACRQAALHVRGKLYLVTQPAAVALRSLEVWALVRLRVSLNEWQLPFGPWQPVQYPQLSRLSLDCMEEYINLDPHGINLDSMPALSNLKLVSPEPVELHASQPAARLTSLTLRILYDQTLCAGVQQHLCALRRLEVQPLCGRSYRRDESLVHLDGLALSSLQALTVGADQVCTVTASHPLPALAELRVAHGDLAAEFGALPALRLLVFEEKLGFEGIPMEQLPAQLTRLECDATVLPHKDEPVWGSLRNLKLTGLLGRGDDKQPGPQLPKALLGATRLGRLELAGSVKERVTLTPADLQLLRDMPSLRQLATHSLTMCVCRRCGHLGCEAAWDEFVLPGVELVAGE